ncbi:hypothetical protein PIB30_028000 [Stylosanthes scabra]|uniref:Uncharacterized protein n=1 Tax=Stylosanthes scabra TaxID=79078 RepID=A0ABU6X8F1_9FABA|nr:hypothetical protein [Stylosanthes scabra]
MDRKRKSVVAKGKGKLATPPTRNLRAWWGYLPLCHQLLPTAKAETRPKAQENIQAPVVKPSTDIKAKKTARISVKPLRKRFSQRLIARGGPSRPKPKKVEVIDLISDEEEEAQEKEAAMEQPPLVANQEEPEFDEEDPNYEEEEEEEDPEESVEPEETPSSWSLLSPFPAIPELGPGKYDDPHNWNYDGDLDQWGTDVAGGEPAAI